MFWAGFEEFVVRVFAENLSRGWEIGFWLGVERVLIHSVGLREVLIN